MIGPRLGCIADDYTGATDLSSMLVRAGLRVIQFFGGTASIDKTSSEWLNAVAETDAVVIALKSRSIATADAVEISLKALHVLLGLGAERVFFKYCSTFDSTTAGNIGPVAEALASDLHQSNIWYCPAFPENGRTVYCGYMFVNGVPLHESGMKDHPLNPMTDSNLVRWLQPQCQNKVGLVKLATIRSGDVVRQEDSDTKNWIVDAVNDEDLIRIASFAHDQRLLTGGSAIGGHWAKVLMKTEPMAVASGFDSAKFGPIAPEASAYGSGNTTVSSAQDLPPSAQSAKTVILAGSCSVATRNQIAAFAESGGPVLPLDVLASARDGDSFKRVVDKAVAWCLKHAHYPASLIASAASDEAVSIPSLELGPKSAALLTESLFAAIAHNLVSLGVRRLIVAGGETSGAVINSLKIDAVKIGREIAPGVPWVHSVRPPYLSLVLKSGNFGDKDFFHDAIACFDGQATASEHRL
ncbi:MAG: four-carbon acid sugar kinase family protein [Pirellulaceae bacterium]|nr:four-carbon acid sugar kinase family protein [Pirellulaceae bacterium]